MFSQVKILQAELTTFFQKNPGIILIKFIYSEKTTKFFEMSTEDLSYICSNAQIYDGDFAKFCGLLRIYEL